MTRATSIMITPMVALRTVPPADRDAVRRFLFQNIRGLNTKHDKRWRRFWGRLWGAEAGEVFHIQLIIDRSGPFHRFHMKFEQILFDNQDRYVNQDHFRNWLKTGAAWGDFQLVGERLKFIPRSLAYEECSDDEMREIHEDMVEFLRTDRAQRRLWPQLSHDQRSDMVETLLADHREET